MKNLKDKIILEIKKFGFSLIPLAYGSEKYKKFVARDVKDFSFYPIFNYSLTLLYGAVLGAWIGASANTGKIVNPLELMSELRNINEKAFQKSLKEGSQELENKNYAIDSTEFIYRE